MTEQRFGRPATHFTWGEVECSHTGKLPALKCTTGADFRFVTATLSEIRILLGHPIRVNSWFRHRDHPIEAAKVEPGPHCTGLAVDLRLSGEDAARAVEPNLSLIHI